MAFQVANGSIPETVERFLREMLEMRVDVFPHRGQASLSYINGNGELVWQRFWWDSDREPTLQEAIEAAMAAS